MYVEIRLVCTKMMEDTQFFHILTHFLHMEKWNGNHEEEVSDFFRRCMLLDLTREVFNFLSKNPSDFLCIDVGLLSWDYILLEDNTMLFNTNIALYRSMAQIGAIPPIRKESVPFDCMSENELKYRLKNYAKKILSLYRPEQIILFEVRNAFIKYDDKTDELSFYSQNKRNIRTNKWIDTAFEFLLNYIPGCHVIRMPRNIVGYRGHKWGDMPMHYTTEYYDYSLKAISVVLMKRPIKEERILLNMLFYDCENNYSLKLYSMYNFNQIINIYKREREREYTMYN